MTLITDLSKHSCETLTISVTLLKDGCIKPKPTSDKSGEDEVAATNRRRRCSFCARYGFVSLQFICYITVLPDVMDSNHAEISRRRGHFSLFMNQMNQNISRFLAALLSKSSRQLIQLQRSLEEEMNPFMCFSFLSFIFSKRANDEVI